MIELIQHQRKVTFKSFYKDSLILGHHQRNGSISFNSKHLVKRLPNDFKDGRDFSFKCFVTKVKHIQVFTFARKSCYAENEQGDSHMLGKSKGTVLMDRTNPTSGWHTFQEQFRDRNHSYVEHKE